MKSNWENEFNKILVDERKEHFGSNIEWDPADAKKYFSKLEVLGAKNIKILDGDEVLIALPKNATKLLTFIITGGGSYGRMPLAATFKKKDNTLRLRWDY